LSQPTPQANRIITLSLEPNDPQRLASLCGQQDEHLKLIESRLDVTLRNRGNVFQLAGPANRIKAAANVLEHLYRETASSELEADTVHLFLQESGLEAIEDEEDGSGSSDEVIMRTPRTMIKPRGLNQQRYVSSIREHDINFGVGPAGTGKTYLAVAAAVEALNQQEVRRILLVRPAVEAGEKLGFLPGDLAQKIDPYLRPLYDALYEMIGFEQVAKLIERQVIEIAPLAYMRGRTLNNSYIILDESQHYARTDENVPDPDWFWFYRRHYRRCDPGRFTQGAAFRADSGARRIERHPRHWRYSLCRQGCGSPPVGSAHYRSLRHVRVSARSGRACSP